MAEPIKFTQLPNVGDLTTSAIMALSQAQGGDYSSYSASLAQVAELITQGVNYEDLPTTAKDILGAITELYNSGGGGGGSNVTMDDNEDGGVNLTVDGLLRVLAKQETIDGAVALEQNETYMDLDIVTSEEIEVYSTEETVVGRWINNKPIYRRVVSLNNVVLAQSNTWVAFPFTIDNIELPINARGFGEGLTSSYALAMSRTQFMHNRNTTVNFQMFILEYTKTTDEVTA